MKNLLIVLVSTIMLFGCSKLAQIQASSNVKTPDQIKAEILKDIPGIPKIDAVNKSPASGIYEITVGRKVFYATQDGKYLFFGNIIDPVTQKSLTDQRVLELSRIDWEQLPLNLAIKHVNGNGKRQLAVFADPDCPYCQMFEKQVVPQLTNTTVYTFLFPLPMHKNARSDSAKIWCSKDRTKAWTEWMDEQIPLPQNQSCDTSGLDKIFKVGTDLVQVDGTPTLILGNGQILPGAIPADQLIKQMDQASNGVTSDK